jgi:hypothetical protein
MSAEDTGASSAPSVATPAVEGPKEIFVGGQQTNLSNAPKDDVTDVTPKSDSKSTTETKTTNSNSDSADGEDGQSQRDSKGRFKGGVQDRIDELTRSRREAEREAAYWRARATGPDSAQPPAQTAAKSQPPEPSTFKTQEEYIDVLTDYKLEQKLASKDIEAAQTKVIETRARSWQEKLVAARTEIPDFDAVLNNADFQVANHITEALFESDHGAKIAHHLAQNPDVVDKLNGMSPAKAALELGRIEASFDKKSPESVATNAVEPRITKAPSPIKPVGAGRATTPSLGDLPMEDYVKARKAQGAAWAR